MGWEKEYEHFRDYGHTWGPGIDDRQEPTEEERIEQDAMSRAYEKELDILRIHARVEYVKAGEALKKDLPSSHDITFGNAPLHWRENYSEAEMELCKKAAESLGYEFGYLDWPREQKNEFIVKVERYGYLPGRGGNLHPFIARGIEDPLKCLQLVADFEAIGCRTTTYWLEKKRFQTQTPLFISEGDTGRLYKEMERWGVSFDKKEVLEKEIKQLAVALDQFVYDFDTYAYQDAVEDRQQAVLELEKNIEKGAVSYIKDWHKDINLDEHDKGIVLESRMLMKWLESVERKIKKEKTVSLEEKILNAKEVKSEVSSKCSVKEQMR